MKKTLITAITTALVVGAASTTFAAANPFSDVPSDHWSYDAVSQLAKDGVIDGYGDGTYRGDQKITRYEMAQMVAKAMAKSDVSAADKAMIDKLAAEYADELNNLGVRVSNLEKKSDNVKFTGLMRLDGKRYNNSPVHNDDTVGTGLLRLEVNAAVNDNWNVKARLDGQTSLNQDKALNGEDKVTLKRIYAEGPLFGADTKVGKFGAFDNESLTNGGLIIDTDLTGAEFIFGNALKTKVTYGRLDTEDIANIGYSTSAADYAAIQFGYTAGKVALGAGYTHLKDNASGNTTGFTNNYGDDKVGIWNVGFDYALSKDFTFGGEYASSDADAKDVGYNSDEEKAYSAQLTYKGAKSDVAGSYGLWAAYRSIGELATIAPTYDGAEAGLKGYELGVNYMLDKNIMTKVVYFDGSEITSDTDIKKVFGRLEFAF
ncbi:S-layer homology domain-containing protein [Propionispira arboris]|uniref:S-layer homology domain-containing protein n=1 Tax=Propionispira arboris TaxID=84035 RepID=A0A1H6TTI8_9FIRM|nr:S-layer homology domain-containing protein [Propionispira arboris]SEI83383.1 S-layer homology domain-containing protein [Propionispira arboris]